MVAGGRVRGGGWVAGVEGALKGLGGKVGERITAVE